MWQLLYSFVDFLIGVSFKTQSSKRWSAWLYLKFSNITNPQSNKYCVHCVASFNLFTLTIQKMTEREQTCNQDDLLFHLCLDSAYPSPTLFLHILMWTALMSKSSYIEIRQVEISLRVAIIWHRWLLSKVAHTYTGRCSHKYIKIEFKQHIFLDIYTQGRQKSRAKRDILAIM